mmetsp:Transcript_65701/g.182894  ORF Transcript_65701/g.182894 Transcript_65701/m.182894 type:complete len:382 (+) Transcript_65701:414-1559(+)
MALLDFRDRRLYIIVRARDACELALCFHGVQDLDGLSLWDTPKRHERCEVELLPAPQVHRVELLHPQFQLGRVLRDHVLGKRQNRRRAHGHCSLHGCREAASAGKIQCRPAACGSHACADVRQGESTTGKIDAAGTGARAEVARGNATSRAPRHEAAGNRGDDVIRSVPEAPWGAVGDELDELRGVVRREAAQRTEGVIRQLHAGLLEARQASDAPDVELHERRRGASWYPNALATDWASSSEAFAAARHEAARDGAGDVAGRIPEAAALLERALKQLDGVVRGQARERAQGLLVERHPHFLSTPPVVLRSDVDICSRDLRQLLEMGGVRGAIEPDDLRKLLEVGDVCSPDPSGADPSCCSTKVDAQSGAEIEWGGACREL